MPTLRERIELERSFCQHPGLRLGNPPRCYLCLKRGLGLINPRTDPPVSGEEELGFIGVMNGHAATAPAGWLEAESILASWGEVEPHPIERAVEFGANSVRIREEARAELEALMAEAP